MRLNLVVVAAGIVRRDQLILLTRRKPDVHLPDLWEFPGGKVEAEESLQSALQRELKEELGIEVEVLDLAFTTTHRYTEKLIELHFFNCRLVQGQPRAIEVAEFRWVHPGELHAYAFPEADRELVEQLARPYPSSR